MKKIIPLALLRKRAREQKDKEFEEKTKAAIENDPTLRHDVERKQSRYDRYGK